MISTLSRVSLSREKTEKGLAAHPVIGRAAGFPLEKITPLSSGACASILKQRRPLEDEAALLRKKIVEAIETRLTEFDSPDRRFLLSIKRDCFNGRSLRKSQEKSGWNALTRLVPDAADRLVALEGQIENNLRDFEATYGQELVRERQHVLALLADERFLRGVAIGTPGLVQKARRKAPSLAASGCTRPPAKWEESLLRFVTRAATKLSANSTLTAYALGSLREADDGQSRPVLAPRGPGQELSLVRIDRPLIEQFQALLLEHPPVRRHAWVAWNDSAEEIEPGTFRFIRDPQWNLDASTGAIRYTEPTRIKVKLPDSFRVPILREVLASEHPGLPYADLVDRLGDDGEETVEQLVSIGFLMLLPPWSSDEPRLERRILDALHPIAQDAPEMRDIAQALDEFVALEDTFAAAPRPERHVQMMQQAFQRLMQEAARSTSDTPLELTPQARFYEDVLQIPAADSEIDRGVFGLEADAAQQLLRVVGLISRFDSLFNLRHDVFHSLAAWWRTQDPHRAQMPFLELAESFASVWKTFPEFQATSKSTPCEPWNPLDSSALIQLREHRAWALARVAELLEASETQDALSPDALETLVESLPERYRPLLGVSVFFQPADAVGSQWVLNNITEGTGRYLSRVTPVLRDDHRERFLRHLEARSSFEVDGDEADLLEVKDPRLRLVRAHPPQTARVLEFRGQHFDLPAERRVNLDELVVQADLEAETFRLVDGDGRRVLPVSISTLPNAGLSNRLRLLLMFGPDETRGIFPFASSREDNGIQISNRLTCGHVVLRRKNWQIPVDELRQRLQRADDASCYEHLDRWRRRCGLPNEGFYREQASCGKNKPQFMRFDSPSLCRLFVRSLLQNDKSYLSFSEALPGPSDYPTNAEGRPQAFELLLDQLSIRNLDG